MNRARLIAGLREVLAALEDEEQLELVPAPPKSKPQKRRPRVRLVPAPKGISSPVDREAARKLLRREGLA